MQLHQLFDSTLRKVHAMVWDPLSQSRHPICPKWTKAWLRVISNTQVLNVTASPEDDQCLGGVNRASSQKCGWHLHGVTNPINGLVNGFPWGPGVITPLIGVTTPFTSGSFFDVLTYWSLEDVISVFFCIRTSPSPCVFVSYHVRLYHGTISFWTIMCAVSVLLLCRCVDMLGSFMDEIV